MTNSDFTSQIRSDQKKEESFDILMFDKDGLVLDKDDGDCVAKATKNSQYEVFHIKRSSRGLFNPSSDIINRDVAFFKVKEEAFENYIHFLKTKDQKFLNNAERII